MDSDNLWIIYDIIALAVIAGTIFASFKKGFSQVIVSAGGYLISCFVATFVSTVFAGQIYDLFVKSSVLDNMNDAISKFSIAGEVQEYISDITLGLDVSEKDIEKVIKSADENNLDVKMYNMINAYSSGAVSSADEVTEGFLSGLGESMKELFDGYVPESFIRGTENFTAENKEDAFRLIKSFMYDNVSETSEYIEENYIRQYAVELVKIFVFIIILFILMFIIKMLENSFSVADSFSGMKFNSVLGGAVGIVESCAFVYIISILLKFLMLLTDDVSFLSEETIEQTKLFRLFYDFDIFG